jgi:very-short-patch-repair endonuclease
MEHPPQPRTDPRVAAAADAWKRKLLDLTKRNRALNFRPAKVSTIAIVDEQPAEVFRRIVVREAAMRFRAAADAREGGSSEPESAAVADSPAALFPELGDEHDAAGSEFMPYDASLLDERHTDDHLQTASTPDALDKSLRRLDDQARLTIEEQGVNTLFLALGMLYYKESPDSTETFRAPLVLVPVGLARKSARSGYTVRAADEDPIVNPALAEYLRINYGLRLPELPDSNALDDDYDLQGLLGAVRDLVADRSHWSVKTEIFLAPFSFQKFVMYKDLEQNAPALVEHRLIRQLVTRSGDVPDGHFLSLPDEIRAMDLDDEFAPEKTAQIVDADSSQLRAIAAASRSYDLVIEGPPGTGKSQTITNLIAQALSLGKSVLFVAEKMAALEVVHDRLVRAGLGEFCLELHSTKASKREVMKALATALDASLINVATRTTSTQRLPAVRATLTEYAEAVHTPHGSLAMTPYRAYGELGRVLDAPRVKYAGPVDEVVTRERLDETLRQLHDLAVTAVPIGVPAQHSWRDTTKTFYSADDLETVRELANETIERVGKLSRDGPVVREALGLPPIATFADVDTVTRIANVIRRSPGAPLAVLQSDGWNQPPAEATALIGRGRELARLEARIAQHLTAEVFDQNHADDVLHVERKTQGAFGFLAFLDGRYRAIRSRWTAYRLSSYRPSLIEQANEMKLVDRVRAERETMRASDAGGRELFGALWQGKESSWDVLDAYVRWVVELRALYLRHSLSARALEVASRPAPDLSAVDRLRDAARDADASLGRLRDAVGWPATYLADEPFASIVERVRALSDNIRVGPQWAAFEAARRTAAQSLAGAIVPLAMSGDLSFGDLASAFLRAFYLKWLSLVVRQRPALERFHTMTHEERVAEFRQLDERVLVENRGALIAQLRDRVQHALREPDAAAAMPFLRQQMARQRNHAPLRRTMRDAGAAVRAIKPCFMMSPLTVAQLLDGGAPGFDLVIFDEASQLPPEDAVGAVIRGRQLIVVGDPKQLPPTNFFAVSSGMASAEIGEDGQPIYDDAESILEQYMGAGVPMSRLKWHYRSAHESLIAFSNVSFYESDLYTFPSVETATDRTGLQFEYVEGGVYEGKGLNAVEARHVADEVVRFAKLQLERRERGEPIQSLGVGTFNLRQQLAIQDELEQRRRNDPSVEPFFDLAVVEPFFVKNLENIQGDERDVIFISVTYARGADGKLRHHFGPLNGENGWRRLNVLATRARRRMKVFSSMRGEEINAAATTARGAQLLREFLTYAERGRLESLTASLSADAESPFEAELVRELTQRGVKVVPQIGTAGYRIDIGVLDDALPGRFLCGIECDGVAYHSSETARDRDRLRQQVLEARGWVIHRVWSTDWFKDRQGQVDRLIRLVDETRVRAREERDAERETRARAMEQAARREAEEAAAATRAAAEMGTDVPETPYARPPAATYRMAPGAGQFAGSELLDAPMTQLARAVLSVVEAEAPLHESDLIGRVAAMWDTRAGSRIQARIRDAARLAERDRLVRRRGEFYWNSEEECLVRSRAGTRIPADRIAPEEYEQAVLAVLATGHGFTRPQLTGEVRALLGYGRTGAALDEAVNGAVDRLLSRGAVGEASTGIRLRRQ